MNDIFIGKDIEIVRLDDYAIIFRKDFKDNYLESRLYKKCEKNVFSLKGICRTSPLLTEVGGMAKKLEVAMNYEEINVIYSNAPDLENFIGEELPVIEGKSIDIRIGKESYFAELDESFETFSIYTEKATDCNIPECLIGWISGVKELYCTAQDGTKICLGIEINTSKHMYIFRCFNDSIYCRAATYGVCNKGIRFIQNFRQNNWNIEFFNAYMFDDNSSAAQLVETDENMFIKDSCHIGDRDIYWSVKSVTPDEIILNGCGGDLYRWSRPIVDSFRV